MPDCTWKGCVEQAKHRQHGNDGSEWAHLCQAHHDKLEAALVSGDAKQMVGAWAWAKSEESRERDAKEIADKMGKLMDVLNRKLKR